MSTAQEFKLGMRRLASGVSLITTVDETRTPFGMVATSVVSVSVEPPTLLICVAKTASSHPVIQASRVFCVNLLSDLDDAIAQRFTDPGLRHARFSEGAWRQLKTGAPAHPGALASFDCEVRNAVDAGSHTIFIGSVVDTRLWANDIQPLIYIDGAYARCA